MPLGASFVELIPFFRGEFTANNVVVVGLSLDTG